MTTVCFTGAGKRHHHTVFPRGEWEHLAREVGYQTTDKIERFRTDILVAAQSSIDRNVSKVRDARGYGLRVISYAEFERMVDQEISPRPVATPDPGIPGESTLQPVARFRVRGVLDMWGDYDHWVVEGLPNRRFASRELAQAAATGARATHRCPVHLRTYDEDGICGDCARIERRRGLRPGQYAEQTRREAGQTNYGTCLHGHPLNDVGICHICATAERQRRAALAEARAEEERRAEAAKLAPIGSLRGKRRLNLDGDD